MKDMWKKIEKIDKDNLSRDFEHLTQAIHTIEKKDDLKYPLAVILKKCVKNEDYKETAIENLAGLARSYEKVEADLKYFALSEHADYNDIKPIAQAVMEKLYNSPQCC